MGTVSYRGGFEAIDLTPDMVLLAAPVSRPLASLHGSLPEARAGLTACETVIPHDGVGPPQLGDLSGPIPDEAPIAGP
jgi:hypothetical protein